MIVCQSCDQVVSYMNAEKCGTLYGRCDSCKDGKHKAERRTK
ncbi:GapA-binding peptide SR1P [Mechercharimyces sp. CAU 1602]|nr:GapA-binding peptide SR1P [Mechercharimyces sp. CAU 1602]MCS1350570.1 GapA-binding peptide SR1P [Mechercharimyces sp. CAU 1602]